MALSIPITWGEAHWLHAPPTAVWIGVPIDADELPERAEHIRAVLESAGARIVGAERHDDAALDGLVPTILEGLNERTGSR
jgi:hypothetical protein